MTIDKKDPVKIPEKGGLDFKVPGKEGWPLRNLPPFSVLDKSGSINEPIYSSLFGESLIKKGLLDNSREKGFQDFEFYPKKTEIKSILDSDFFKEFSKEWLSEEEMVWRKACYRLEVKCKEKKAIWDAFENVIQKAAYSELTTSEEFIELSSSHSWLVRFRVARNTRTASKVLESLVGDRNRWVSVAALKNPKTPERAIRELANREYLPPVVQKALKELLLPEYNL